MRPGRPPLEWSTARRWRWSTCDRFAGASSNGPGAGERGADAERDTPADAAWRGPGMMGASLGIGDGHGSISIQSGADLGVRARWSGRSSDHRCSAAAAKRRVPAGGRRRGPTRRSRRTRRRYGDDRDRHDEGRRSGCRLARGDGDDAGLNVSTGMVRLVQEAAQRVGVDFGGGLAVASTVPPLGRSSDQLQRRAAARVVAPRAGIDEVRRGAPGREGRHRPIQRQPGGARVATVGDGINDAPCPHASRRRHRHG